jgi:spermidine synthase
MKPWELIEKAKTVGGTEVTLHRRGDEWMVRCEGAVLMWSQQHGSADVLAKLALRKLEAPRDVFVGGLGLGYTARAALDLLPRAGRLTVAEFTPAIAEWNRTHVGHLAKRPLDDPRTTLFSGDAVAHIYASKALYDALLLDIDNGPDAMVHASNRGLYGDRGIAACFQALRPGGVLAVWSAAPDDRYLKRLELAGFVASSSKVAAGGIHGGPRDVIFLGVRPVPKETKKYYQR